MALDVADGKTRSSQFGSCREAGYSAADDEGVDDRDAFNDATRAVI
jgi:hypothetical protein